MNPGQVPADGIVPIRRGIEDGLAAVVTVKHDPVPHGQCFLDMPFCGKQRPVGQTIPAHEGALGGSHWDAEPVEQASQGFGARVEGLVTGPYAKGAARLAISS